jgi:acetyl-CoA synthetase
MARTCHEDHARYLSVYMKPYPGYYFTGDGASYDQDGHLRISGRVDDVINVSGHRLGTAEVESALVSHPQCAESAVIAVPHDIKGQCLFAFVSLLNGVVMDKKLETELKLCVRKVIGGFAIPDYVVAAPLPKTRSGKIMRRIVRKLAEGETDLRTLGDLSTLNDIAVVHTIIAEVAKARAPTR